MSNINRVPLARIVLAAGVAAFTLLLGGAQSTSAAASSPPRAQTWADDLNQPFNEVTWVTAHNAFNTIYNPDPFANQTLGIKEQLDLGVRGLMLDLKFRHGQVVVCHDGCGDYPVEFWSYVAGQITPFLDRNPNEIITLHLEDQVSRAQFAGAVAGLEQAGDRTFKPSTWDTPGWPTLQQMIDADQRLVIIANTGAIAGDFTTGGGRNIHVTSASSISVENYWSLGGSIASHDRSCSSRWGHIPISTPNVSIPGKNWPRLFTMNHSHGWPTEAHAGADNSTARLHERVANFCTPAAGRKPNYLAIDFVHKGHALPYAGALNQGGIVLWKDPNPGSSVDDGQIVCAIPGTRKQSVNLKHDSLGCNNDKASSAEIIGAKPGMRFVLSDDPDGGNGDDQLIIDVLRAKDRIVIPNVESSFSNADVRVEYRRHNGLKGKVSHVSVQSEVAPYPVAPGGTAPTDPGVPDPDAPVAPIPESPFAATVRSTDYWGTSATFNGTGRRGATVTVTTPTGQRATTQVAENGRWSASLLSLPLGAQTATATLTVDGTITETRQIGFALIRPVDDPCTQHGAQFLPECDQRDPNPS